MSINLRVSVTKDIIMSPDSKARDPLNCAVVRSIQAIFPRAAAMGSFIYLDTDPVVISHHGISHMQVLKFRGKFPVPLPAAARAFIAGFDSCTSIDSRDRIEPIDFYLEIPDAAINGIDITALLEGTNVILVDRETAEPHISRGHDTPYGPVIPMNDQFSYFPKGCSELDAFNLAMLTTIDFIKPSHYVKQKAAIVW